MWESLRVFYTRISTTLYRYNRIRRRYAYSSRLSRYVHRRRTYLIRKEAKMSRSTRYDLTRPRPEFDSGCPRRIPVDTDTDATRIGSHSTVARVHDRI